jgi:hypothetical protein
MPGGRMTAAGGSDGPGVGLGTAVGLGTGVAGSADGDALVPGVTSGVPVGPGPALEVARGEAVAPSVVEVERIGEEVAPVAWLVADVSGADGGTGVDEQAVTSTSVTTDATRR